MSAGRVAGPYALPVVRRAAAGVRARPQAPRCGPDGPPPVKGDGPVAGRRQRGEQGPYARQKAAPAPYGSGGGLRVAVRRGQSRGSPFGSSTLAPRLTSLSMKFS
ncbi:hypothetical protein GCM10017688_31700 [Streptomyces ramulosus]